jgi:hypothetical protein
MGYTTEFYGSISIEPALSKELVEYINNFSDTRRMKRDIKELMKLYSGEMGFNGSYGREGEYFVTNTGDVGQKRDSSIVDYNEPPSTQPSLWCDWVIMDDGQSIEWNGAEKFYCADEWMVYILENFIDSNIYKCNGEIEAQGEDTDDRWKLVVKNNVVSKLYGRFIWNNEEI